MSVKNFWWHERVWTAWGWDKALCNLVLSTFSASIPPLPATLNIVPSGCNIFFFSCCLVQVFPLVRLLIFQLQLRGHLFREAIPEPAPHPPDGVNQALLWSPVAWRHLFAAFFLLDRDVLLTIRQALF